jgi:alcohol dehydrogenase (quinone), cytochrome c subunit
VNSRPLLAQTRNRWGNQAPVVTATQVAKLRKTTNPTSDQVIILKMR